MDGAQSVHIAISDTGPGIPSDQMPHLFDRFWRAERNTKNGVGLGLAIVRGIVDAHGGRIDVASREAHGSCFTIVLPVRTDTQPVDVGD
jgi:signal transduction histidine kinase